MRILLALLIAVSAFAGVEEVFIQKDTFISYKMSDMNYGNHPMLKLTRDYTEAPANWINHHILLDWDYTPPEGCVVDSVTLYLYPYTGVEWDYTRPVEVNTCIDYWIESIVTWDSWDPPNNYGEPSEEYEVYITQGSHLILDITDLTAEGAPVLYGLGLLVKPFEPHDRVNAEFYSSESGQPAEYLPRLEIEYHVDDTGISPASLGCIKAAYE